METRNLTCIGCPMGCPLTVEMTDSGIKVTGNTCKRGETYGKKEVTAPERSVTSTVRVLGGAAPVVSCRTERDIPKEKIFACMEAIKAACAAAPIAIGDVLVADAAGTGVNVIATKQVDAAIRK